MDWTRPLPPTSPCSSSFGSVRRFFSRAQEAGMYSFWNRLNAIVFLGLMTMILSTAGSSIVALWHASRAPTQLDDVHITHLNYVRRHFLQGEEAILEFAIDADLSDVWNWNVKQLFVYVMAEFSTDQKSHNVVVWDRIITDVEDAEIKEDLRAKYLLTDEDNQLRGANVTLALHWDIMPWIGVIKRGGGSQHNAIAVEFPKEYI